MTSTEKSCVKVTLFEGLIVEGEAIRIDAVEDCLVVESVGRLLFVPLTHYMKTGLREMTAQTGWPKVRTEVWIKFRRRESIGKGRYIWLLDMGHKPLSS